MFDHFFDLPDLFHHSLDATHHDWAPQTDLHDAHGQVVGHANTDQTGVTTYTDAHGNWTGHSSRDVTGRINETNAQGQHSGYATLDHNGLTFQDSHGNVTGYDYPFGGVDHYLDMNGNVIGGMDSLGSLHDAHGNHVGDIQAMLGTNPKSIDTHYQVIEQAHRFFATDK